MSCSKITADFLFWKVSFSFKTNCLDGSNCLVLPFFLVQFIDFKTPRAQSSRSSSDPPFSLYSVSLFDLITASPVAITIRWLTTVPAVHVLTITSFTFFIRSSERRFSRTFFLKIIFLSLFFFILVLQLLMDVLWTNFIEPLNCCFGSVKQCVISGLLLL